MAGIIVGVDGSTGSHEALKWAVSQAALQHAALTVLTVHPVVASAWTGNPVVYGQDVAEQEKARQAAEDATAKLTSELDGPQPASVAITAVNGFVAKELIDASKEADLLVVGSRGGGGFTALALGSVTTQVVAHAHCPVVVVRPHH